MADIKFSKPVITNADLANTNLIMAGYMQWAEANNVELPITEEQRSTYSSATPPTSPMQSSDYLDTVDKYLSDDDPSMAVNLSDGALNVFKEGLSRLGLEEFLEDGEISTEEYILAGSAAGNKALETNPDRFNLSEAEIEKAAEFVSKHGIGDPDGSIAMGIAANAEATTQRANEGFGITQAPDLQSTVSNGMAVGAPVYGQ